MKISRVSVTKGLVVGTGKFESVRLEVTIEKLLEEPSTGSQGRVELDPLADLWELADEQLNKQLGEIQDIVKPDSVFKTKGDPSTTRRRQHGP